MSRFVVTLPRSCAAALRWVAGIVFGDMLGMPFEITEGERPEVVVAADGRRFIMSSNFPDLSAERQHWRKQLPKLPLTEWNIARRLGTSAESPLPVLFGQPEFVLSETEITCGIDIFGTIFFMLSRFEEVALPDRDNHDRFPATASLAWKGGFLYRPIVDEYVELLWTLMKRLWPGMERKRRQGQVKVSCDVDQPFDRVGTSARALARSIAGDIGRRKNPALALRRARNFFAHRHGDLRFDPYYTFDWYMDVCEKNGHKAAFYFIADHSAGTIDGTYEIDEPRVLGLMRRIDERGHEIGMHGSYNTFRDHRQIAREKERLSAACKKAGLDVIPAGNRQHYLRWDSAETPDHLDTAGFDYDTTGAFADRPGFRYGTSHPFPMWSWKEAAPLSIRQQPLVLMECSVIAARYLDLGYSVEAFDLMLTLKYTALKYGGDFALLWHNSEFLSPESRVFFKRLLS